jgi:hypothetical protein
MNNKLKEQLQKKSLAEIEAMILGLKQKMGTEKNLSALQPLNSELVLCPIQTTEIKYGKMEA